MNWERAGFACRDRYLFPTGLHGRPSVIDRPNSRSVKRLELPMKRAPVNLDRVEIAGRRTAQAEDQATFLRGGRPAHFRGYALFDHGRSAWALPLQQER